MHAVMKFIHRVARWCDNVSCVACVVMMLIAALNCILRRFGYPLASAYDYVCFLLVLVVAPSLAQCAVEDGHIFLSLFTDKMKPKAQSVLQIVIDALCSAFCLISAYALFLRTFRNIDTGLTGMTTDIPVWPFVAVECIAMFLLGLVFLFHIVACVDEMKGGKAA